MANRIKLEVTKSVVKSSFCCRLDLLLIGRGPEFVNEYKYLGCIIPNAQASGDGKEVEHQYQLTCCRATSLTRKCSMFVHWCENIYF